ncbi:hypothetical protein Bca4012_072254 [Brassica carinata]
MHETLIFNEQDLRSNPFKGRGGSVAQISSKDRIKKSKSELHQLHKDLQLWPHHPRPRQNVIHADMRSMESLYHTPSMCGKTRDGPGEAGHGPRLKSEYGDHCTRPLDQENHVRRFTLILDQVVLRDDQNLLILGQMGLVRPPEWGRRRKVSGMEVVVNRVVAVVVQGVAVAGCKERGVAVQRVAAVAVQGVAAVAVKDVQTVVV